MDVLEVVKTYCMNDRWSHPSVWCWLHLFFIFKCISGFVLLCTLKVFVQNDWSFYFISETGFLFWICIFDPLNDCVHLTSDPLLAGSSVTQLKAEDPENEPLLFGVLGEESMRFFSVNPDTGVVWLRQQLDREVQTPHMLASLLDLVMEGFFSF